MGTNPRPNTGKNTPGNQIQVLICLIYHHTGAHPTTQYRYTPLRTNMGADPSELSRCTTIRFNTGTRTTLKTITDKTTYRI